jgi:hypothetical protein
MALLVTVLRGDGPFFQLACTFPIESDVGVPRQTEVALGLSRQYGRDEKSPVGEDIINNGHFFISRENALMDEVKSNHW